MFSTSPRKLSSKQPSPMKFSRLIAYITFYKMEILIIFTKQTQLKNTGMKNRFQPVCLHFSTDFSTGQSEPLSYLTVTCNFSYKELIYSLIYNNKFESAKSCHRYISDLLTSLP